MRRGSGCPSCSGTGYRGRLAIHELLPIDRRARDMILARAGAPEILDYMKREGHNSLMQDGFIKVIEGLTTTEEILRVATAD